MGGCPPLEEGHGITHLLPDEHRGRGTEGAVGRVIAPIGPRRSKRCLPLPHRQALTIIAHNLPRRRPVLRDHLPAGDSVRFARSDKRCVLGDIRRTSPPLQQAQLARDTLHSAAGIEIGKHVCTRERLATSAHDGQRPHLRRHLGFSGRSSAQSFLEDPCHWLTSPTPRGGTSKTSS